LYLHHTSRQFFNQHTWAHLDPEIGQSNSRAAIIAPQLMQWEAFSHRFTDILIER
jgi:hypothetical protein